MPSIARTADEAVWAFDSGQAEADLATLHQLRIAGKWLRYTLEFVREPLEPEAAALIGRVEALQETNWRAARHARRRDPGPRGREPSGRPKPRDGCDPPTNRQASAIDGFVRHCDERTLHLRRTLGRTWRPLVAPDYRRRLGRGLARL
jgi:hypothetical protein